jgi:hypothetical protein
LTLGWFMALTYLFESLHQIAEYRQYLPDSTLDVSAGVNVALQLHYSLLARSKDTDVSYNDLLIFGRQFICKQ